MLFHRHIIDFFYSHVRCLRHYIGKISSRLDRKRKCCMLYVSYHIGENKSTFVRLYLNGSTFRSIHQTHFFFPHLNTKCTSIIFLIHYVTFLSPVNTGNPRARVLTKPKTNAKGFAKKILKSWRKIIWVW